MNYTTHHNRRLTHEYDSEYKLSIMKIHELMLPSKESQSTGRLRINND